jgi:uncharacterized membrane protein YqhA
VRKVLESARYTVVIAVVALLIGAVTTFLWGLVGIYHFIVNLIENDETAALLRLLSTIDILLLATVLLVFAVGLWELFIGELDLPDWLDIQSLDDLKTKLADVIVLVVAIKAFEKLATAKDPMDAVKYAAAAALIVASLSLSSLVKSSRKKTE